MNPKDGSSGSNDFGALDRIVEAEAKAKEMLEEAGKKKHETVEKAKKDSDSFLDEAKKNALQQREKQILALQKSLEKEKEKLSEQNKGKIGKLKQEARAHLKKEADFLVEKFLGEAADV
ncbi:MAG: hypothetical protein PHD95_06565 [Candidatus ainarchaeum sp.]|nr:hypothetical protein [Candidatus ainarchaeum sp.]